MTNYEIYVFILCFIVFVLLTGLSVTAVTVIVKLTIKLIRYGDEDEYILHLFKPENIKKEKIKKRIDWVISLMLCIVFGFAFLFSLVINLTEDKFVANVPAYRVICSESMSKKHSDNTYLAENNLNNQLDMFDLAKFNMVSSGQQIELYDIVVYQKDNNMICHRIVDIVEQKGETVYVLQGDAVKNPDTEVVRFEQIKAVYAGEKIPHICSFILFLQSPAGWLCILLVVFAVIATPVAEGKLEKERAARYEQIKLKNIISDFDKEVTR